MYLTYAEYTEMGGSMDESLYNRLEFRAEKIIDSYTYNRVKVDNPVRDEIKRLTFEIVGELSAEMSEISGTNATKSSEKVGDYSVSYAVPSGVESAELRTQRTTALISEYLGGLDTADGTPLLYAGVVSYDRKCKCNRL
jgi:hypothetical protein